MESKIKYKEIAQLRLMSWSFSANGEHYYAYVRFNSEEIQLQYRLTVEQAETLNKKDSSDDFEAGDLSKRFFTPEQAYKVATEYFHENLTSLGAKMLWRQDDSSYHPHEVVAFVSGYEKLAEKFTSMWRDGEKLDWDWKTNYACRILDKIVDEWKTYLCKKPFTLPCETAFCEHCRATDFEIGTSRSASVTSREKEKEVIAYLCTECYKTGLTLEDVDLMVRLRSAPVR